MYVSNWLTALQVTLAGLFFSIGWVVGTNICKLIATAAVTLLR